MKDIFPSLLFGKLQFNCRTKKLGIYRQKVVSLFSTMKRMFYILVSCNTMILNSISLSVVEIIKNYT